jgi:exopolysaccharide biosynthesis protein
MLLAGLSSSPVEAAPLPPNCRSQVEGITYCRDDGGATQVLIVDLTNPYVRVQTAMANDVLDVRPIEVQRERVSEIAQRYRRDNVMIAINGDYFGADRGPEGPTVVQGVRLDTSLTIALNPSRYRRTTLVVSRFGHATIVTPLPSQLNPAFYQDVLFNAISGGPVILRNGAVESEIFACVFDDIPAGSCRRARQSAAGVDADGHTLYLAVSTVRSTGDMARLLRDYGADDAMKLDGGGSSQLWYNGRTLLDSDRGVANALLVFVEDRPRHAAQLMTRPSVPIVEVNEPASIEIDIRNTGFLDWTTDRGYGLRLIDGAALFDLASLTAPRATAPDEVGRLVLSINGSGQPGVYGSTWQMIGGTEGFGAPIPIRLIVIPRNAGDLQSKIQALIAPLERSNRLEQNWPKIAPRIGGMIKMWLIENPDPNQVCRGRPPC